MQGLDLDRELNALGIPFNLVGYETKAPAYPYGIYLDDIDVSGGDDVSPRRTVKHEIIIELYHKSREGLFAACAILEKWLDNIPLDYRRELTFIVEEDHYLANYKTNYSTKKKKG